MITLKILWLGFWIRVHTRAVDYFQKKRDFNARELRRAMGALMEAKYGDK